MIYLLPTVAALSAPLSRRNAITGSLAAAAVPGASNTAPSATTIGYDDVVLDLPCGARVPACVWLPSDGADAPPASYKYRISAGRLVKTILGLPTPDAIARSFDLAADGVRFTPGATVKDGTSVVVVAHGFLGTRFDLSKFGEALAREGAVAIAPDFDETLAGSYTPDSNGGSSRDKIVVAALGPVWKSKLYGVVIHAIEHPTHWLISTQVRACEAARGHWQHRRARPQRRRGDRVKGAEYQGRRGHSGLRPGWCRRRTIPRNCERRGWSSPIEIRSRAVPRRREKH